MLSLLSEAADSARAAPLPRGRRAGPAGVPLLDQAEHAFVNGMSNALLVAACVLFGASGLVALLGPRGARAMDEARQTGWVAPKPARQMGDGRQ